MMRPLRTQEGARRRAGGIGIVTAIFLLVVLAALGTAIVTLTTNQVATSVQDQQGARSYQAARAGIEWALYIALRSNTPATPAASLSGCTAGSGYTFAMPPNTTLSSFSVTVTCEQVASTAAHFWIRATACNEPNGALGCPNNVSKSAEYVQRVVEVQL